MTTVSIVEASDYNRCGEKISRLFALSGGPESVLSRAKPVLLKPNLLMAPKYPGDPTTTNGNVIVSTASLLVDHGYTVFVGDSPAFGSARSILRKMGIEQKLMDIPVEIIEFQRASETFRVDTLFRSLSEYQLVNLAKLKVHVQMGLTMCVKNLFGLVPGKRKPLLHNLLGDTQNAFAERIVGLYAEANACFHILDAIEAMDRTGPRGGDIKRLGYLFAGIDGVAVDTVLAHALNIDPDELPILRAARKLRVGATNITDIRINGLGAIPQFGLTLPPKKRERFSLAHVTRSVLRGQLLRLRAAVEKDPS